MDRTIKARWTEGILTVGYSRPRANLLEWACVLP